jgi:hypothetical protein
LWFWIKMSMHGLPGYRLYTETGAASLALEQAKAER